MTWWFSYDGQGGANENRPQPKPARKWVKNLRPELEPLEERWLLTNNVWLPQRLAPLDGTSAYNQARQLFLPAATGADANLWLQATTASASGSFSLTDTGGYSLSLTQSGPFGGGSDRYTFSASGPVSFTLVELGTYANAGFSVTSLTLTQTASVSWSFTQTDAGGQTVGYLNGLDTFTVQSNGAAPFDPLFAVGFNWLSIVQQVSNLNSLNLPSLAADTLSVNETGGTASYTFAQTNGLATVQGNVQQPLADTLDQTGQVSFSSTSVTQPAATYQGNDSFSLSLLGQYANGSYALGSVAYQETGSHSFQMTSSGAETQSGTGSTSQAQSFSGNNHTLGGSASDSFQLTSLRSSTYGESGSGAFTLTQSGIYGGGSFSLNSLNYSNTGGGGYSLTRTTTDTQTGSFSGTDNASGTDSFGVGGSLTGTGTTTQTGIFTYTSINTLQESSSGTYVLTQLGGYSSGGWALSSFNLTQSLSGTFTRQHQGTLTQNGIATTTHSGASTDSYALDYGGAQTTSAIDTVQTTETTTESFSLTALDSASQTGSNSYTLTVHGAAAGGSYNLSSYVFTASHSGTWTTGSRSNQTTTGTSQQTTSSSQTSTWASSYGGQSNNDLAGGNFSSSDSFSFTSTQSTTTTGGGGFSQSVYRSGTYGNGSYSLGAASFTATESDSWTFNSTASYSDSGQGTTTGGSSGQQLGTTSYGGGAYTGLGNQSSTETSTYDFTNSSVSTVSTSGSSSATFSQFGVYAGYSFAYGSVTYQTGGSQSGTFQDASTATQVGTVTSLSTGAGNQSSNGTFGLTAAAAFGSVVQTTHETFTFAGTVTESGTTTSGGSWSLYQQGAFSGGSWALASVNYSESFSSTFDTEQTALSSASGSESYTSNATTTGDALTTYGGSHFNGLNTVLSSASGTDSTTDTSAATLTQSGGSSWSLSQQGVFSAGSFALTSVVHQGAESFTETYTASETHTFEGSARDSTTIQGRGHGDGLFAGSQESGVQSATQNSTSSFTHSGSAYSHQSRTATECSTFYEAGQFAQGSYSLVSLTSAETATAEFSYSEGSTSTAEGVQTQTGTGNGNQSQAWDQKGGWSVYDLDETVTGAFAETVTHSATGSGTESWSLVMLGAFSNFSASYNSVVSREFEASTSTESVTSLSSFTGTRSLTRTQTDFLGGTFTNGQHSTNGLTTVQQEDTKDSTVSSRETHTASSSATGTTQLYQAGQFAFGSFSLSSVSYSASARVTESFAASQSTTETRQHTHTTSGTLSSGGPGYGGSSNDALRIEQDTLGTETTINSDTVTATASSSWSLTEQGTYANNSYSFSNIVYEGSQSSAGTTQHYSSSCFQSNFTGSAHQSTTTTHSQALGQRGGSGQSSATLHGTLTLEATQSATESLTQTSASQYDWYQQGSYAGDSYSLSSLSYLVSASNSVSMTSASGHGETAMLDGTTSNGSIYTQTHSLLSNTGTSHSSSSAGASVSLHVATQLSSQLTLHAHSSFTQSAAGSYAGGSYAFSGWLYQAESANSFSSAETSTVGETLSANGSSSYRSYQTFTSVVAGSGSGGSGGSGSGGSQSVTTITSSNLDSYSDSYSGSVTLSGTVTRGASGSFSSTHYQSGVYSGGSFSFSSMAYTENSVSTTTSGSESSRTSLNSVSADRYQSSSYQGGGAANNYSDWSSGAFDQTETVTSVHSQSHSSVEQFSLSEQGTYAGGSWSLSSYALHHSSTTTDTLDDTYTPNKSAVGTNAGEHVAGGVVMDSISGVFTRNVTGSKHEGHTFVSGFSLDQEGTFSGGAFALSCFVFAQDYAQIVSSSVSEGGTGTFGGTNTVGGTTTFDGLETSGSAGTAVIVGSASIVQRGVYQNGSFSLSSVSYSASGSDSISSSGSATSGWSGGYEGSTSRSEQSGSSSSYSVAATGSFSAGSFSLDCYVLTGNSVDSVSSDDASTHSTAYAVSSLSRHHDAQQSTSLYQAGSKAPGGAYANASYLFRDQGGGVTAKSAVAPGLNASDSWTQNSGTTIVASGTGAATSSATYTTNQTATIRANSGSNTPANSTEGAKVAFAAPSLALVPSVGAGRGRGSGPGSAAPVPVAMLLEAVGNGTTWFHRTERDVTNTIKETTSFKESNSGLNGGGQLGDAVRQLGSEVAAGLGFVGTGAAGWMATMGGAESAGFAAMASGAVTGLLNAVGRWSPEAYEAMRTLQDAGEGLLEIERPQAEKGYRSGDPFVDWVDRMLDNGGAPLTAGSAPLYGTYWDGMGHSAQEALSKAAPYVQGGVYLVGGMWMVGPQSLLGFTSVAVGAFAWAGTDLAVNLAGGATPEMLASSAGQSFYLGAVNEIPGIGNALSAYNSVSAFSEGDLLGGVLHGLDVFRMRGVCFAGEMLLDVEGGKKRAEAIAVGDKLWSRSEFDPEGPLALKEVEEVYVRTAPIWNVHVAGQIIRTTEEHPFWVENRGCWLQARELQVGDLLRTRCGSLVSVEGVADSGAVTTVYNWRIADYHTYFVSATYDGVSIWAHNYASIWPPTKPKYPRPANRAPGIARWRYNRYVYNQRQAGKRRRDIKSFDEWYKSPQAKAGRQGKRPGQGGTRAHKRTVDRLVDMAKDEFPGDRVHRGTSIEGVPGAGNLKRRPDVWVEDGVTGRLKKVYEAARKQKSGKWVPRERAKLRDYGRRRIPYHFEEVR